MGKRENVSGMVRRVEAGEDYVIQGSGKPLAVVIAYDKYEKLIAAYAERQAEGKR